MKITIKTLAKTEFPIECEESDTVKSVKEKIEETKANTDQEMPVEAQKLIALGKIMENEKTLADYKVKEGSFLVVMVTKPKKPKKPKEEPKPAEPAASDPVPMDTDSTPAAGTEPAQNPSAPPQPAASAQPAAPGGEETLNEE